MANSKASKKLMNMVYGLGAAVVILGALFKIMHWPFGNLMLIIGLITEAVVFTVSAFEPVDDESIRNFEGAAKGIAPTVDSIQGQKKYSEEMQKAATSLESLNSLYKVQLESSSSQAEANKAIADNAQKLKDQMESLTSNLSSLNGVYGGMLSAMNRN